MSRSKHTDPLPIRAKRRVQSPREPRSAGDPSLRQRLGRMLKEKGIVHAHGDGGAQARPAPPRVTVQRPQSGFFHPARRVDVFQVLDFVGPEAIYGVRCIELSRASNTGGSAHSVMGRLVVPGRILLYEQPLPPWRLTGTLAEGDTALFRQAGAVVEVRDEIAATTIDWSRDTLRYFMIFEVLLHEIGHHILQHNKGKRTKPIARTQDHEAFAQRFAQQCRTAWFDQKVSLQ